MRSVAVTLLLLCISSSVFATGGTEPLVVVKKSAPAPAEAAMIDVISSPPSCDTIIADHFAKPYDEREIELGYYDEPVTTYAVDSFEARCLAKAIVGEDRSWTVERRTVKVLNKKGAKRRK